MFRSLPECLSSLRLENAGVGAAVDQDALPGDEPGRRRAQEGAGRAELRRIAEPAWPGSATAPAWPRPRPDAQLPRRASWIDRSRSVSNDPGSRKLIVTLACATDRATPARKPVSPARAPLDRSSPGSGIFTDAGGDVDDPAEPAVDHPVDDQLHEPDRGGHVRASPRARSGVVVDSRKSRGGGPPLLLTRMSTSAPPRRARSGPSRVPRSAATGMTRAPVSRRISSAVRQLGPGRGH